MPTDKWKSQYESKSRYARKIRAQQMGRKNKGRKVIEESEPASLVNEEVKSPVEGCRLIDIQHIIKQMYCTECRKPLLLQNIVEERIAGLGVTFDIKCDRCEAVRSVTSSPLYDHPDPGKCRKKLFAINSKIALGALHTGNGQTQIDKILKIIGLPGMNAVTFKAHERIIGKAVEAVAAESCEEAIRLEKQLTQEDIEAIQQMLPSEYQEGFILIEGVDVNGVIVQTIRIVASFDMGWTQRANGYSYDSLNGYCCLIGLKTGKVLVYRCYNRKCRQCEIDQKGGKKTEHDCRLNSYGSAKSMEAQGAVDCVMSQQLKDNNVEIGVLVADNDSSSIAAVQNAVNHTVLKQADMNHTTKGVSNKLHEIAKSKSKNPDDEMSNDFINHLKKCFASAVKQNKGNLEKIREAIKNIPNHIFGDHKKCGTWCQSEKENYSRSYDVNSPVLFQSLKQLFDDLGDTASNFIMAGSSQANESINNSMCSKHPKRMCYSTTAGADFRFACTVSQKNLGEKYILKVFEKINVGWNDKLEESLNKLFDKAVKRYEIDQKPEYKRKRVERKTDRTQLRNRKEAIEGPTYSRNLFLFDGNNKSSDLSSLIKKNKEVIPFSTDDIEAVFFDLETGGFDLNKHEILQICMISEKYELNIYITPTKAINPRATQVHGLTKNHTKLYKNGVEVPTIPLRQALQQVLLFLQKLGKKCLLIAHNCTFDSNRLFLAMKKHFVDKEFGLVLSGFLDSLPFFKNEFKTLVDCKLTTLASKILNVSDDVLKNNAHDALYDVEILKRLVIENISFENLIQKTVSLHEIENKMETSQKIKENAGHLESFQGIISKGMIQRLAEFDITYKMLLEMFKNEGADKIRSTLRRDVDEKPTLDKRKNIIDNIIKHLENVSKIET